MVTTKYLNVQHLKNWRK